MAGMSTINTTSPSSSSSRTVEIKVTGVARQDLLHTSNYTIKVPYRDLSRTIQGISRMGGKVAEVTVVGSSSGWSSNGAPSNSASTSQPSAKASSAPAKKSAPSKKEERKEEK